MDNCRTSEEIMDDGHVLSTSQIYEYLSNVMYDKRTSFDPFWNAFLVGGVEKGEPYVLVWRFKLKLADSKFPRFLSYVDLLGTTYSAPTLATGYGNHLAQPLLRRAIEKLGPEGYKAMDEALARSTIENAMKVLFYRDARSLNKVSCSWLVNGASELILPF